MTRTLPYPLLKALIGDEEVLAVTPFENEQPLQQASTILRRRGGAWHGSVTRVGSLLALRHRDGVYFRPRDSIFPYYESVICDCGQPARTVRAELVEALLFLLTPQESSPSTS